MDSLETLTSFRKKNSQCRKNWEGGPFGIFNIHSVAKQQKNWKGDPLGIKISGKKSRSAEKKLKGDPLVLLGMVCYTGKQEKPSWFNSLGQMVQFGAIIICWTFKNYFGQFVWIERKQNATKTAAFHFMKHRLKTQATTKQFNKLHLAKKKKNTVNFILHMQEPCVPDERAHQVTKKITQVRGNNRALTKEGPALSPILVPGSLHPLNDILKQCDHFNDSKGTLVFLPKALEENFFADPLQHDEPSFITAAIYKYRH